MNQTDLRNLAMLQPRTAPIYKDVAIQITPTNMPPWLPTMLSNWAPSLALYRGVHAKQPTKARMRKQLTQIRDATAFLLQSLQDTPTREFLEIEGRIRIENLGGLQNALRGIGDGAALATASPRISVTSTSAKSGTGKALPENAESPKTFCALIIAEIWNYLHNEYPAPRNRNAAQAADTYWRASGGLTKSWGSDPLSSWRYHFKLATSLTTQKDRREIRRHCVEHSRSYQMLSEEENN